METLGMRLLLQREKDTEFDIRVPQWIAERMGGLLLMTYDGETLTLAPAE